MPDPSADKLVTSKRAAAVTFGLSIGCVFKIVSSDGESVEVREEADLPKSDFVITEFELNDWQQGRGHGTFVHIVNGSKQTIERISLQRSDFLTHELGTLASLERLKHLDLSGSSVGDEAVSYIVRMKSLDELDISGTKVTPRGVAAIRKALPDCKVITQVAERRKSAAER